LAWSGSASAVRRERFAEQSAADTQRLLAEVPRLRLPTAPAAGAEVAELEHDCRQRLFESDGHLERPFVSAQLALKLIEEASRLRELVRGADKLLTPGVAGKLPLPRVQQIYDAIKSEVERG